MKQWIHCLRFYHGLQEFRNSFQEFWYISELSFFFVNHCFDIFQTKMPESTDVQLEIEEVSGWFAATFKKFPMVFSSEPPEMKEKKLLCVAAIFKVSAWVCRTAGNILPESSAGFSRLISDVVRIFFNLNQNLSETCVQFLNPKICSAPNSQKWRKTIVVLLFFLFFSWFSVSVIFSMGVLPIGTSGFVFGHGCAWWVWLVGNHSATFWGSFSYQPRPPVGTLSSNPICSMYGIFTYIYQHLP